MTRIILLGPQRHRPTVATALARLGGVGRLAVISAGWQEREAEFDALGQHLAGSELTDLELYRRAEEIFEHDAQLHAAWHGRQQRLQELQRLYRRRLRHLVAAAKELGESPGTKELVQRERVEAVDSIRDLDRQHLRKIREIHADYAANGSTAAGSAVERHKQEIAELLTQCDALLVAGGHVAVLLNRMRLFDMGQLIGQMPVVAWSAGAMALSEQVVLFHDFPPQGAGNAELFDAGLAVFRDIVVLPDASRRLALDDGPRVALLADRLRPARSIGLDEESMIAWNGKHWRIEGPIRELAPRLNAGTVSL